VRVPVMELDDGPVVTSRLPPTKAVALASIIAMFPVLYFISWLVDPDHKLHTNISALFQHKPGSLTGGFMLLWIGLLMTVVEWRNRISPLRRLRVCLSLLASVFGFLGAACYPDTVVHMGLVGALYTCFTLLALIWASTLPSRTIMWGLLLLSCVLLFTHHRFNGVIKVRGSFVCVEFLPLVIVFVIWFLRPEQPESCPVTCANNSSKLPNVGQRMDKSLPQRVSP
jgi:hypothetical protein